MGKTVLLQQLMDALTEPYLLLDGESIPTAELLGRRTPVNFRALLGSRRVLLIDEARKIPDSGSILKLMIDEIEGLRIVATASSAFVIYNLAGDPLTGRKSTLRLFAVSEQEFSSLESLLDAGDN